LPWTSAFFLAGQIGFGLKLSDAKIRVWSMCDLC
jgi:hypothetical protein